MPIPILNSLKNELERLYIAGSSLARNDPRISKYIPGLNQLGERAPVFKSLAERLSALTQNEASPESLMDAGNMLFSLIYSQGRSDNGLKTTPFDYSPTPLAISNIRFSELDKVLSSIKPKANNCFEKLEDLCLHERHKDPRLYMLYVTCVKQGNTRTADTAGRIIQSLGSSIIPVIWGELDINGGAGDARLFNILYGKLGRDILPLSERVLVEGSADVISAALYTLGDDEKYTEILKNYSNDRRKIVREAAEKALSNRKGFK